MGQASQREGRLPRPASTRTQGERAREQNLKTEDQRDEEIDKA